MKPDKVIELNLDQVMKKGIWWNAGLLLLFAIMYHILSEPLSFRFSLTGIVAFIVGYIVLIVLHELFHLIGFIWFGRVPLSSLNYGINLEMGIAYATSTHPVKNKPMRKVLLLPFWTTGMLPTLAGFWLESQVLVLLGAMLVAGAIGDFLMYRELLKEQDEAWIVDDPEKPKLHVYYQYPN